MFFLKWGQKGKDWIKKWISVSRSVATFWPSLIFYSKIRAFLQVDSAGTKIKEDALEVNDGKSLNWDTLSLGSLTAEGSNPD